MTSPIKAASLRGGSAAELDFIPDRPIPAKPRRAKKTGEPQWNRVIVGDALAEMRKIAADNLFDVAVVDPPYNIGKDFGNNADRREMPDYLQWTDEVIAEALRLTKPSAPVYVYGQSEILARVAARRPLERQRWLVWHYTNKAVPRLNFWQRSHESILCLWKGARPKIRVDAVRESYTEHYKKCAGKSAARNLLPIQLQGAANHLQRASGRRAAAGCLEKSGAGRRGGIFGALVFVPDLRRRFRPQRVGEPSGA